MQFQMSDAGGGAIPQLSDPAAIFIRFCQMQFSSDPQFPTSVQVRHGVLCQDLSGWLFFGQTGNYTIQKQFWFPLVIKSRRQSPQHSSILISILYFLGHHSHYAQLDGSLSPGVGNVMIIMIITIISTASGALGVVPFSDILYSSSSIRR